VLIFCSTKVAADKVTAMLKQKNHSVVAMHSDRTQRDRIEALDGFKAGRYEVLVATDLAARGLDIAGVSHVINYDVPGHPEDYVHRIGRTGRAQNVGDAFTIFSAEDMDAVRKIERFIGMSIPRLRVENFEYLYTALFNEASIPSGGAAKGGRTLKGYSFGRRKK
jgi:ATP-dependent RNA helicase RhlE